MAVYFTRPSLYGILFALGLGLLWLMLWRPVWRQRIALLALFLAGAALYAPVVGGLQLSIQRWIVGRLALRLFLRFRTRFGLVMGVPLMLISGLFQEAGKLLPAALYVQWRRPAARWAFAFGAAAGAGFSVFETQWVVSGLMSSGWSWEVVQVFGWRSLIPFWERVFLIGFHEVTAAISAYGWAGGGRWRFFGVAVGLNFALTYGVALEQAQLLSPVQRQVYLAAWAIIAVAIGLFLRRRAGRSTELPPPAV